LVLGSLLLAVSWREVIATSAVITGGVLLLLFFVLKQSPTDVGLAARGETVRFFGWRV
jgi:sugar phosphate permease